MVPELINANEFRSAIYSIWGSAVCLAAVLSCHDSDQTNTCTYKGSCKHSCGTIQFEGLCAGQFGFILYFSCVTELAVVGGGCVSVCVCVCVGVCV